MGWSTTRVSTAHKGWAVGGAVMAAAIIAATTWSAGAHPAPVVEAAAAPATSVTPPPPASASPAAATAPAATTTATTSARPPLPAAQGAATHAELAALAKRLPAHVALTAPAAWAKYAGSTPSYAEDAASCPSVAAALGARLGQRWTYTEGRLPAGPVGCSWTPAPWVPDRPPADRLFVTIGFQQGPIAELMAEPGSCGRGSAAPEVPVPAVAPGAVLSGCLDDNGTSLGIAVPDPAGTGVWTIGASGGVRVPTNRAASALLALVDASRKAYR